MLEGEKGAVILLGDGNDSFAREVAPEHQDIGAIEFGAVDELLEADVRSVQVGREEDDDLLAAIAVLGLAFPEHVSSSCR